jgi:antitoxin ChpS
MFNNALHEVIPMEVVLRKYGNSTVMAFPPAVLKELGLKAGQAMTLNATSDGRITLVPKRRHKLADLIAQCDPKAPPPLDLRQWNHARPVGREVW